MGVLYTGVASHGQQHQEIVGSDSLVTYGHYERIKRVKRTTVNATASQFTGDTNNVNNTLQSGHTWTLINSASGNLNYTGDSILGTQCIQLTSDGSNGVNTARATSPRRSMNLTGKMIRLWLKFDTASYANISTLFVYVGSGSTTFANYATCQIASSPLVANAEFAKPGEWVAWTFNPASFPTISGTIDWTAIQDYRLALNDNGAPATIYIGGIDFVANDSQYPNGVVSLTFDDGWASPYTNALPRMEQYGFKGTFYVIEDLIGSGGGNYMSVAQLNNLQTKGHEIAFHSAYIADHNAANGYVGLGNQELMKNFGNMKAWMHQNGYRGNEHMALPQGFFDTTLLALLKQQFAAARLDTLRTVETLPIADPYRLRPLSASVSAPPVSPNTTPGNLEWRIDQAALYGGWIIIVTHEVLVSGATGNQTAQSTWNTLLDYIASKGMPVRTVGDILEI